MSSKSTEEYFNELPVQAQLRLKELESCILEECPNAKKLISHGVPAYGLVEPFKHYQQILISAYSKYVSIYPSQKTIDEFENELADFKRNRNSIRFPLNKEIPKDLIVKMVRYKRNELLNDK